jgi:N-methylhydantoinase B
MRLPAVTVELLRNYFQGTVDEMAHVVERTAYTTFVKETGDFTTGLLTPGGDFFAYPRDIGVSSFAGISYARTLEAVGPVEAGDVIITNDPYTTDAAVTHLPDIHVLRPVFAQERLVAFTYAFIHCSDVGGMVPASITPRATEIFQEGLRLPPKKIYRAGVVNQDLLDVILANCRIPEQNWGDLKALFAGLATGERRFHRIVEKFGLDTVEKGIEDLIDYAERKVRAMIARMPRGRFEFSDYIEDDVATEIPIRLKVAVTIGDGDVEMDFTGSDAQVASALNLPTGGHVHPLLAFALTNYLVSADPTIPMNAGMLRPLRMVLPSGSVVNPQFPAACGVRYATVLRVYDTVLGALSRCLPAQIPAAGAGQGCMVALSLPDHAAGRRHVTVVEPMIGGGGGRPTQDGINGCDASLGFLRTTPVESLETEVPIVVRRFDLVAESAGAGRYRGGFGVRLDFQVWSPEAIVTARGMERLRFQPWGVLAGHAGATGSVVLNPGTPGERPIAKIDVLTLDPGDVLSIRTPGGGGYGNPLERPAAEVLADVRAGLLSVETVRRAYGVVLRGLDVDEAATAALRRSRLGERAGVRFDLGPAREEHEAVWTPELYERFLGIVMSLPVSYRPYVRRTLFRRLRDEGGVLEEHWQDLARRLRLDGGSQARRARGVPDRGDSPRDRGAPQVP